MTEKIDLSTRYFPLRRQSVPGFSNRQYTTGTTTGGKIFAPNCAATVQWIFVQVQSQCNLQLFVDGYAISALYTSVPAGTLIRFPGLLVPNNAHVILTVTAGSANFEVAWTKDYKPELICDEPAIYSFGSGGGGGSTVTANQGTALAGAKWSVQIDAPAILPVSISGTPAVTISGQPISVNVGNFPATQNVAITGQPISVSEAQSNTANAQAQTAVSNVAGQILAANASRKEVTIINTSTAIIYLGLGAAPSTTAYHIVLSPCAAANDGTGGSWISDMWTGAVQAIGSVAGTVVITELT